MVALRVFCSYWVRKALLSESPFWRVKLSFGRSERLSRSLTEREVRALLTRARHNYEAAIAQSDEPQELVPNVTSRYRTLRDLAMVDLLFATGMRVGEVSTLNISDFLVKEAVFKVQGKGRRDRLAFIVDSETVRIQRARGGTCKNSNRKFSVVC